MGHEEISREMFEGYSNGLLPESVGTKCVDLGVPNDVLFGHLPTKHADASQCSCGREIGGLLIYLCSMPQIHCPLFTDRPVGPHATDHSITALLSVSSGLCILSLLHSDAALVEIMNKRTFTFSMHVFS